jgi:hypothetical protein
MLKDEAYEVASNKSSTACNENVHCLPELIIDGSSSANTVYTAKYAKLILEKRNDCVALITNGKSPFGRRANRAVSKGE